MKANKIKISIGACLTIFAFMASSFVILSPLVAKASPIDEQIAALNKKVQEASAVADSKKSEADTLKGMLASI